MIICNRYDINGIANQDELIYSGEYLHFFESLNKPGYYLIIKRGMDDEWDYERLNSESSEPQLDKRTFYLNCRAKTSKPISIGCFENDMSTMFLDYIKRNYIVEHFLDEQEGLHEIGWYKFKKFAPEKWLNEFLDVVVKWRDEHEKEEMKGQQLDLF